MTLPRDDILEQVSTAIDAAEKRAAEIEREARQQAETILAEARAEAKRILDRAQSAVAGLAAEIGGEVPEPPAPAPEPPQEQPEPTPDPVPEPEPPSDPEPSPDPAPEPTPLPGPPSEEPPPAAAEAPNGSVDGARLVAMKMALEGTAREDVAAHLADAYGLSDSDALLNDVFARAGGR